jgi:hypothetical protein
MARIESAQPCCVEQVNMTKEADFTIAQVDMLSDPVQNTKIARQHRHSLSGTGKSRFGADAY